jgi:hypothetical protein
MARLHYPYIPRAVVPDAYPSIALVRYLLAPLLVLHGERDEIVPASHGEALFHAAPAPKRTTSDHDINDIGHAPNVSGGSDVATNAKTTSTTRFQRPERTIHVFPRVGHNDLVSAAAERGSTRLRDGRTRSPAIPPGVDGAGPSGTSVLSPVAQSSTGGSETAAFVVELPMADQMTWAEWRRRGGQPELAS